LKPLESLFELSGARMAIIGAGGAARALLWSARQHGARTTVFARDTKRAAALARAFDADVASNDGASFDGFDIVINATPLGTRGRNESETVASVEQLRSARIAYDLVYNPTETRFLREAREAGCETIGGLQMLVAQATEQFKLWTGMDAPLEVMSAAAERQMLEVGG
jgi:shikimate 5-dehydrogenase